MVNKLNDKLKFIGHQHLELLSLSSCSFADAVELWNEGFKGYAIDLSMSMDDYVVRLRESGISVEHSVTAIVARRPVGFLLNGIRKHAGKLVAWNGGTGVIPEFRGQAIGRALVVRALQIYKAQNVEYATLEAISTNTAAISLYKSWGYEVAAELTFLQHQGKLDLTSSSEYSVEEVPPSRIGLLPFYEGFVPWQAQWQSIEASRGYGLIVYEGPHPRAYALFRRQYDDNGELKTIYLHQCFADPTTPDGEKAIRQALASAFSPLSVECRRSTHNFNKSNKVVLDVLQRAGFTTYIEQVMMQKDLTL